MTHTRFTPTQSGLDHVCETLQHVQITPKNEYVMALSTMVRSHLPVVASHCHTWPDPSDISEKIQPPALVSHILRWIPTGPCAALQKKLSALLASAVPRHLGSRLPEAVVLCPASVKFAQVRQLIDNFRKPRHGMSKINRRIVYNV